MEKVCASCDKIIPNDVAIYCHKMRTYICPSCDPYPEYGTEIGCFCMDTEFVDRIDKKGFKTYTVKVQDNIALLLGLK